MNRTPDPDRDRLDRLLDETLKDLPEMQAPDSLLGNIMARVAEEEEKQHLSWFARLQWPVVAVSAAFVFLATYFGNDALAVLMGYANTEQYAGEIQNVNLFVQLMATLGSAASKVINLVPSTILYSAVALIIGMSAFSCAGLGTALFRLSRSGDPLTHQPSNLL